MKTKKAISLIVLVITIIVMIILAGAIVVTLANNGIIGRAQDAVEKANLKAAQELAQVGWSEAYLKTTNTAKDDTYYQTEVENYLKANGFTEEQLNNYIIDADKQGVTVTLRPEGDDGSSDGNNTLREGYLSGTWKFNDTLSSLPYGGMEDYISQSIAFTVDSTGIYEEQEFSYQLVCSGLEAGDHFVDGPELYYYVESVEPDYGIYDLPQWLCFWRESWYTAGFGEGIKTITFTSEQQVSTEFWTWFTSNAKQVIEVDELPSSNIDTNVIYKTYEYLDIESSDSNVINAGTYRFNDVLSAPSADLFGYFDYYLPYTIVVDEVNIALIKLDEPRYCNCVGVGIFDYGVNVNLSHDYESAEGSHCDIQSIYSDENDSGWNAFYDMTVGTGVEVAGVELYRKYGQTITITEDQTVSEEFGEWFTANAKERVEKYYQYNNGAWVEL